MPVAASIDQDEIARFSEHAQDWWNPQGAMRPLHKLNPARLEYIRDAVCGHFKRQAGERDALAGLSVLDIGCGAGLLCEPMARLGATVTGLDASADAIEAAKRHAALSRLSIDYRNGSAEELARGKEKFDVITALEIVEHVADLDSLMRSIAALLKPKGIALFSTVNRTTKSYLLGIVAAEYVLRWVPAGAHDWHRFVRPSEMAAHLESVGMRLTDLTGMIFDPLQDSFYLKQGKVDVNYLASAIKG